MKIRHTIVASAAAFSLILTGCSASEGGESTTASSADAAASAEGVITVEDNFGTKEIPQPLERVAATDNRSFEILADWGIELVAAPVNLIPKTVDAYSEDTVGVNLGSHREPDLEALVASEPQVVINGQRFSQYQEDIETLVPDAAVVDFEPRDDKDFFAELIRQTEGLGTVFGKEEEAAKLVEDFNAALERAKAAYNGESTVMALNASGGELGYIAPGEGRFYGPIFDALGLKPALEVDNSSDDHEGDDISVEAVAESNPDWIMVLDRDGGTSAADEEGYVPAETLIKDNAALKNVTAVQDSQLVFAPADTYTNENIITYTEVLNAIADAFEAQQ